MQEIYEELYDRRAQENAHKKAVLNLHVPVGDMLGADEADEGDEDEEEEVDTFCNLIAIY